MQLMNATPKEYCHLLLSSRGGWTCAGDHADQLPRPHGSHAAVDAQAEGECAVPCGVDQQRPGVHRKPS